MTLTGVACGGALGTADESGGTGEPVCFGNNCNGVWVYCLNAEGDDDGVDESGGTGTDNRNYWWDQRTCEIGEEFVGNAQGMTWCKDFSMFPVQQQPRAIKYCAGPPVVDDPLNQGDDDWAEGTAPEVDDEIRAYCSEKCVEAHDDAPGVSPKCVDADWSAVENYDAPSAPSGLDCSTMANLNVEDPDGSEIPWEQVGGTTDDLPLSCNLDDDCADMFVPSAYSDVILPGGADLIDPETRHARYLGVEASGSELEIDMPGSGAGVDDTEPLFGIAEFSEVQCSDEVCPFYLANLIAYNTTDTWDLTVPTTEGSWQKDISAVQIDLIQSTIGVLNTQESYVAFAPGAIRLRVQFTVANGCPGLCNPVANGTHYYIVENEDYVFAEYSGGELNIDHTFTLGTGGSATLTVTVEVDEGPPVASHDLSASEDCDAIGGLELDEDRVLSTDPDDDIDVEFWRVDGVACNHGCIVPFGTHTVVLETVDERGAVDVTDELEVTVSSDPGCWS